MWWHWEGLQRRVFRAIVGKAAADRSDINDLVRQQAPFEETNRLVTDVTNDTVPSPPRVLSRMTDPLPLRVPPRRAVHFEPNVHIPAARPKRPPEHQAIVAIPAIADATDMTDSDIRKAYYAPGIADPAALVADMPALPEMKGIGRYRQAVNTSRECRVEHVRRKLSNLTEHMIDSLGPLGLVEKDILDEAISERSSESGSSRHNTPCAPVQYTDHRRGVSVQKGFTPSTASTSYNSIESSNRRKSSSQSSIGVSQSSGAAGRQHSNAKSELSSPLRTINEGDVLTDIQPSKIEKPCEFTDKGDPDSAVASDDEDDWADEMSFTSNRHSLLSKSLKHEKRRPGPSTTLRRLQYQNEQAQDDQVAPLPSEKISTRPNLLPSLRNYSRIYDRPGASADQEAFISKLMKSKPQPPEHTMGHFPVVGTMDVPRATWEAMKSRAAARVDDKVPPANKDDSSTSDAKTAREEQPSNTTGALPAVIEQDEELVDMDNLMVGPASESAMRALVGSSAIGTTADSFVPGRRSRACTVIYRRVDNKGGAPAA